MVYYFVLASLDELVSDDKCFFILPQYLKVTFKTLKSKLDYRFPDIQAVVVMVKKISNRKARSFTDCFKLRRTPHQRRPATTIVTRSQSHIRDGLFRRLPSELFDMILDQMSGNRSPYCIKYDTH